MTLDNEFNTAYMGKLYLGTPEQEIRALFDSGSANTWVFAQSALEELSSYDLAMGDYYAYDHSQSNTAGIIDEMSGIVIEFGSGTLEGVFTSDVCTLGDPDDRHNSLKLESFDFGLAEKQDNIF